MIPYTGYEIGDEWSVNPVPTTDFNAFYQTTGWSVVSPSDPKITADVIQAKRKAVSIGDTKFAKYLDFILTYGDRALTTLSKNGIIKNQNIVDSGYSFIDFNTGQRIGKDTAINNAPAPNNRVFNVDFTDPKVLIIVFLVLLGIGYFVLKPKEKSKR